MIRSELTRHILDFGLYLQLMTVCPRRGFHSPISICCLKRNSVPGKLINAYPRSSGKFHREFGFGLSATLQCRILQDLVLWSAENVLFRSRHSGSAYGFLSRPPTFHKVAGVFLLLPFEFAVSSDPGTLFATSPGQARIRM